MHRGPFYAGLKFRVSSFSRKLTFTTAISRWTLYNVYLLRRAHLYLTLLSAVGEESSLFFCTSRRDTNPDLLKATSLR